MSEHTPGPWECNEYVVDRDGREVGATTRGHLAGRVRVVAGDFLIDPIIADMVAGSRADARLIAAAPEMLERLETHKDAACLGRNNVFNAPGCGCGPCLDRAVIAKATEGT